MLNVTDYSMQNSSLSRESDMPSSYAPLGQGLRGDSSSQWSWHGSIRRYFCSLVCSAAPIITSQPPKRSSRRTWGKATVLQGNETSRTAIEKLRQDSMEDFSQVFSAFFILESPTSAPARKDFFCFLFCSQVKTVTWQWSIANNKHQQNFASYHSGYISWSLSFPPRLSVFAVCEILRLRIVYYFDDRVCRISEKECKDMCTNKYWLLAFLKSMIP